MPLGKAVKKSRPHFGQSVSWKAALGTCWDAASRPSLDLPPASSPDEGCLESPNCGQGSWPGVWEDVHPVRGTRPPGQNAAAPRGSSRPRCFRGPTEENEEIPVSSRGFWSLSSEDKATLGAVLSFCCTFCGPATSPANGRSFK